MEKLGFYIVRFKNEAGAPGIIASNWLCGDGSECFYPNVKTNEMRDKLLIAKTKPDQSWGTHPIRIIGTYETYDAARQDLPLSEETSDLDRSVDNEKRRGKKRILALPGEDVTDDDMPPTFKRIKKKPSLPKTKISKHIFNSSHSESTLKLNKSPPHPSTQPSTSKHVTQLVTHSDKINLPKQIQSTSPATPRPPKYIELIFEKLETLNQLTEDMSKSIVDLSSRIDAIDNKVDAIDNKIDQVLARKGNFNEDDQEKDFTDVLPLRSLDAFIQLEQLLQDDPSLRKKMVRFLSLCGGRDIQKTANNVMARLMVDELAICYNLTGKSTKGSAKNAFVSTRQWQIVLQTCQNVMKGATTEKIKECVANWLHQSKTRIKRRAPAVEIFFDDDNVMEG